MSNEHTNEELVSTAISSAKKVETILNSAILIGLTQSAANMAFTLSTQSNAAVAELNRRVNEAAAKARNTNVSSTTPSH